jgi:ATP-binding cassette subfamily F protein uup
VLVTHDRYLLDRVSTRILALDGRGGAVPYADYDQWEAARSTDAETARRPATPARAAPLAPPSDGSAKPRKLGYRDQREWDEMEARILHAEAALAAAQAAATDPGVASDHEALSQRLEALASAQLEVDRLYARWVELEAKARA